MTIRTRTENGYMLFYDDTTGRTVEVLTAGPKILNFFSTANELYTDSAVNSSTSVIANGICTVTTGAANDDDHDFTSGLIFDPSKGLTAETRNALGDADQTAFNFGFSDAITEAADKIAVTFSGGTPTSNATDAAVFFSDSDATTDKVRCIATNNTSMATPVVAGIALVDAAYHDYKIEIDPAGNVKCYYDSTLSATFALGVATTATLCAYFALINRESAANTAALDYFHCWQWNA